MNPRGRILAKLRAVAAAPAAVETVPDVARHYARQSPSTLLESVHMLKAQMDAAHAEVIMASAGDWPQLFGRMLTAKRVRRLLINDAGTYTGALLAAMPADIEPVEFVRPIEKWKSELFDSIDAGFTVADAGIAATGTLILSSGPRKPRSTSLVPPLHLALLRAETIYPDLHAAAQGERWNAAMPTNLVLVSGPSKTSDIQQTVAYGAHGPRELVVVIVVPEALAGVLQ